MNSSRQPEFDNEMEMAGVAAQLARIQASPRFAKATRLCQLLSYLVENSVSGDDRNLLECAIAAEVFGRRDGFDSQADTIVRVSVRRLRKFLGDYYRNEGSDDPVRFHIPTGHYQVEISLRESAQKSREHIESDRPWYRSIPGAAGLAIAGVLAIAGFTRLAATTVDPAVVSESKAVPALRLAQQLFHRRGPGEVEKAVEEFEQVVVEDTSNVEAWIGLASALRVLAMEDPETHEKNLPRQYWALHKALTLDPSHPEANARMAGLHASAGDVAGTSSFMSRALEFGRENNLVLSMIAGQERAGGNLSRAIELQRSANNYPPLDAVSFSNLAYMLYEIGDFDQALEVIETAQSISPQRPEVKELAVKILILQGEIEAAERILKEIPAGLQRRQALVLLHFAAGRDQESLRELHVLAGQSPSLDLTISMAEAFAFRGEHDAALHEIKAAYKQIQDRNLPPTLCCLHIQTLLNSPYFANMREHPGFFAWANRARAFVAGKSPNLMTLATLEAEAANH